MGELNAAISRAALRGCAALGAAPPFAGTSITRAYFFRGSDEFSQGHQHCCSGVAQGRGNLSCLYELVRDELQVRPFKAAVLCPLPPPLRCCWCSAWAGGPVPHLELPFPQEGSSFPPPSAVQENKKVLLTSLLLLHAVLSQLPLNSSHSGRGQQHAHISLCHFPIPWEQCLPWGQARVYFCSS